MWLHFDMEFVVQTRSIFRQQQLIGAAACCLLYTPIIMVDGHTTDEVNREWATNK